jgi:hypothetical protein
VVLCLFAEWRVQLQQMQDPGFGDSWDQDHLVLLSSLLIVTSSII